MKRVCLALPAFGVACATVLAACTVGPQQGMSPTHALSQSSAPVQNDGVATSADFDAVETYIKNSWRTLRRSNHDLLKAAIDPKSPPANGKWPVYIAAREDLETVRRDLLLSLPQADMDHLDLRQLGSTMPTQHGILYVPHPYVVPGGRFNEMYGWDSYFIVVGLLRDDEIDLAKDMTDNLLYEVQYYGSVLNANRSYYLTRSQPPLLSAMVMAVYERTHDKTWLKSAIPVLEKYHRYWVSGPHLTNTGLSRYYDSGVGPAPEVVSGESDSHGVGAYARAKAFYRTHVVKDYDVTRFYDAKRDLLTDDFFEGDRSMRESGYDPSERFGPFNVGVTSYNPVCLNTLLVVMEQQLATMHEVFAETRPAEEWRRKAQSRADTLNKLTWDTGQGMYFDYDFEHKLRHPYPFATTFFPLWAGLATPEQAAQLVKNLPLFEAPGGLLTSNHVSGSQWDAPYGWAPLQLLAVEGLRRYGYMAEANRISLNFLSMVLGDFLRHHAIYEKYDMMQRASDASGVKFGYTSNEVGFGWTNAAFEELYAQLPANERSKILQLAGQPIPARAP